MELYSKDEDCFELYKLLRKKLGARIEYYGTPYNSLFSGKYFFHYREPHSNIDYLLERGITFYYKYCAGGFLRIGVGTSIYHQATTGEKLVALSDFYEALKSEFGEPTVFYTTKDDDEECLSFQWSFINKEEELTKFKNNTYFDDAEIDTLIIIGDQPENNSELGLPIELTALVEENRAEYDKYKKIFKETTGTKNIPRVRKKF